MGRRTSTRHTGVTVAVTAALTVAVMITPSPADGRSPTSLAGVPRADCGPGSAPETAEQGRVPASDYESGRAEQPYTCNTELVAEVGVRGGYKVERYLDADGNECAYYDSTLLFPKDVAAQVPEGPGVHVIDMSDPSAPVQTTTLVTPAMLSPHESLLVNRERGLLAAVLGNPTVYPGMVDIYDISQDCRQPVLLSSTPTGILGHESGFTPDGNTFWAASISTGHLTAIDVSDPRVPKTLWTGRYHSHGLQVSDDGTRAYIAANSGVGPEDASGLIILDVSSVQDREPDPEPTVVSELTWPEAAIPQNAIPVTIDGRAYVVEIDEFVNSSFSSEIPDDALVGGARIIDISDETAPRVVSNIRLEVHDPEIRTRSDVLDDPQARSYLQGYAGHYCNVPKRDDPGIVACSFILSGLRVFDIRDPLQPREIAYYNTLGNPTPENPEGAPYAMSSPAFVPERSEIWYSDGVAGLRIVRLTNGVWSFTDDAEAPAPVTDAPAPAPTAAPAPAPARSLPATGGGLAAGAVLVAAALAMRGRLRASRSAWR